MCRSALLLLLIFLSTYPQIAIAQRPDAELIEARTPNSESIESKPSFDLSATYTSDIWHNEGGANDGWRYLDNLDIMAEIDLEQVIGWNGATVFAYALYNNGNSLSDLTGDAQIVSNIETGTQALRLYEAWIEQELPHGASIKAGLYDLNSEFDALETSALFLNSAHGIGTDIAQSGENGPSIFPVTSLALRFQVPVTDNLTIRFAALDGTPGKPASPAATAISLNDGALVIGELDWTAGNARIIAGAWGYTSNQERLDQMGKASSNGYYLRGEVSIFEIANHRISGFTRIGMASDAVHPYDFFLSAGLTAVMFEDNKVGFAVAHARASDASRSILVDPDLSRRSETAFELTFEARVTDTITLQPSIQYIKSPGSNENLPDALATGLRLSVEF